MGSNAAFVVVDVGHGKGKGRLARVTCRLACNGHVFEQEHEQDVGATSNLQEVFFSSRKGIVPASHDLIGL